ncbi:hypothetical protein J6590_017073 [Homalodisca vitripennis]|nr:hypothetical protein J6590_017073 [Homalodisca vitripennis]
MPGFVAATSLFNLDKGKLRSNEWVPPPTRVKQERCSAAAVRDTVPRLLPVQ